MGQVSVLLLDGAPRFEFDAKALGLRVIPFGFKLWPEICCWQNSPQEFQLILKGVRGFLSPDNGLFDFIILGEYGGLTQKLARLVPDQLKEKTIIVRDRFEDEAFKPYAEMGFKYFSTRKELGILIISLLHEMYNAP